MMDNIDFSQFELKLERREPEKEIATVVPSMQFTLFLDMTDGDGILEFCQKSLDALGGLVTHYEAENMKRPAKISEKGLTLLPTWINRPSYHRNYYLGFYGGKEGVSAAMLEMQLWFRPVEILESEVEQERRTRSRPFTSRLVMTLPLDHSLAEPANILAWIKSLALVHDFPFHYANCGYGLTYDVRKGSSDIRKPTEEFTASTCLRHPGFHVLDAGLGLRELWRFPPPVDGAFPLIDRINWLTLINEKQIASLGGRDFLKQTFSDESSIIVHELGQGIMIQAGDSPQIGDIGKKDFIPLYRKVAKVLRPVRVEKYGGGGFGYDESAEWLEGLDKDYE